MRAIRRLGTTPKERDETTNVSGSPDILELDDGSFAVTRKTLLAARKDIPEA